MGKFEVGGEMKTTCFILLIFIFTSPLLSCGKSYDRSYDSNAVSNNIPPGANLILDASSLSGAPSSSGGSCGVTNWADASGSGNNGTINCAVGGGFSGSGLPSDPYKIVFNGLSTSVTTLLNAQPSVMPSSTWMAWVKPAITTFQQILSVDSRNNAFNRSLVIDNSSGDFGVFNPFNSIWATLPVSIGVWQFVAITFTSTDLVFTKNGSQMNLGTSPNYTSTPQLFTIGRSAGAFADFYSGSIAWIAVYPRALTATEIKNACRALLFRFDGATCN